MCDVEWSVSSHRQTHGSSNCCGARCDGFPNRRRPPVGSHGLDLAATNSYPRDTTVTVPPQQATFQASNTASLRLSTEGLVLRKSLASANAFRCFFAEGKIGDSMHAEPHFHTSCTLLFSKWRLKRKDFQEIARLPWAQEVPSSNLGAPTTNS